MKAKMLSAACMALFISVAQAQDFTFQYNMEELNEVQNQNDVKDHFLGQDIAMKMQLLKESYTYKEVNEISNTENTVIEKPSIYNSVRKLSKHLKKSIKKGNISEPEAFNLLDNVLNIALNIRYQDTAALESELWKIKEPDELARLFTERIALEM